MQWKRKSYQILWDYTQGIIDEETITQLRDYVISHYTDRDSRLKVFNFVKKFMHELSLKKGYNIDYLKSKLVLPKNLRIRNLNQRIIVKEDIVNIIDHVHQSDLSDVQKLEYVSQILFLAYTGQRPIVSETLEVWQLTSVLDNEKPVLEVFGEQDKTRISHRVPLHPVLVRLLKKLVEGKDLDKKLFKKDKCVRWLSKNPVLLRHTTDKIMLKDMRKFFEQQSDLLEFNETFKNMIMCHGLSSVQFRSYKQITSESLYDKYMERWGNVQLY